MGKVQEGILHHQMLILPIKEEAKTKLNLFRDRMELDIYNSKTIYFKIQIKYLLKL
jgi:hypothetical protein